MSTLTYSGAHRERSRLVTFAASAKNTVVRTAARAVAPHKAALGNLRAIPLTVLGTGCIDFAAFHLAHGWGWLVTGISCVVVEHIIADESE